MIRRPFGWTGVEVSVIGQGTWQLRDKTAAREALRAGLDVGMTHLDTAELYRGSEEAIAPVIRDRRSEVFLVSKVLPRNASYEGTLRACERSLARLGTDHLDVFLLHWNGGQHPLSETMRGLAELADRGLTRYVGVSNFDVGELEEAKAALGRHRLACNQVLYHLRDRGMEAEVLPWCKRHGVAVVAYSPFGSTGGFPDPASEGGRVLSQVARQTGRTPRQVALAFLTRDPTVFAIPKSENADHTRSNAGGAFVLPKEAAEALDAAFPMKPGLRFL